MEEIDGALHLGSNRPKFYKQIFDVMSGLIREVLEIKSIEDWYVIEPGIASGILSMVSDPTKEMGPLRRRAAQQLEKDAELASFVDKVLSAYPYHVTTEIRDLVAGAVLATQAAYAYAYAGVFEGGKSFLRSEPGVIGHMFLICWMHVYRFTRLEGYYMGYKEHMLRAADDGNTLSIAMKPSEIEWSSSGRPSTSGVVDATVDLF